MSDDAMQRFLNACDELDRLLTQTHAEITATRLTVEKWAMSVDGGVGDLRTHADAEFKRILDGQASDQAELGRSMAAMLQQLVERR